MKLNLFFLNTLVLNCKYFFKKSLNLVFTYFINFDEIPLLLKNIEFIRFLQTSIFFLLQTSLTTKWFLTQLNKIESKFIYLDKKFQLKKLIEKKLEKFSKKLKKTLKNFIIFVNHLRKFKMYNQWGWWRLESFIFPSSFIRYFYVSKSSTAFVKRFSIFFKKIFLLRPINLFLKFLLSLNYIIIIRIIKSLLIYKKVWLQQFLLQYIQFY